MCLFNCATRFREFYFKEQFVSENAQELRFPRMGKSPLCKDVSLGKRRGDLLPKC